jgi:hypothetical protein
MSKFVVLPMLLASLAAPQADDYPPKGSAEQRADFLRNQKYQVRFEQKLFVQAGFQPLDAVAREHRMVKRVLFTGPWMMPVTGVEIERLANGSVTLRVIDRTGVTPPAMLPSGAWKRLTKLQGKLFKPEAYVPWDPPKADDPEPPVPPVCHGWVLRFGTADRSGLGSGSWAQCGGRDQAKVNFATEVARLAASTRPDCASVGADWMWAVSLCFSRTAQP